MADPRLAIARRDLAGLRREKTIVLALLIQLFVAAFSSFLVVGLTSMYDPSSVESGGVEMAVTGEARDELLAAAEQHGSVQPVPFEDPDAAREDFADRRVHAVLEGSYADTSDGGERTDGSRSSSERSSDGDGRILRVRATAPESGLRTTLVVVQVRQVLQTLERQERFERVDHLGTSPVPLPPAGEGSPYFGFTYTVLVPLLLFLPPFISGSVAVDAVTEEIERGTLELLRAAPVSLVDVVDGKSLAMVLLAPAQAALWILLLRFNGTDVANPLVLLAFVAAVATLTVVIGVVLGLRTGRRRPAQLLYSVGTLVVFGGAVVLPEHPATTAAKLAVDSPTALTYGHVAGYVAAAVALYALARRYVDRVEPEGL